MMLHSFEDNAGIYWLTEVLKMCYRMNFCRSCFSTMVSFRYVLVFLNFFLFFSFCFCFCFMSSKYYSGLDKFTSTCPFFRARNFICALGRARKKGGRAKTNSMCTSDQETTRSNFFFFVT